MRGARVAWRVATVVLALLAAVAALLPPRGTPGVEVADLGETLALVLHFTGYAVLAFAAIRAQVTARPALTAAVLVAYGSGLEVIQWLATDRSFQFEDLLANALGVVVGVVLGWLVGRRAPVPH